jgi:hypothetical protein
MVGPGQRANNWRENHQEQSAERNVTQRGQETFR